jgi:hypothetical protein
MIITLTGHTCGDACWHAKDEICRCSCGGKNHGILNRGGAMPTRTRKIGGEFYELAGIAPSYGMAQEEVRLVTNQRFPGLDMYGYGEWRDEANAPVIAQHATESQNKWPEVAAVEGDAYIIWSRPAGIRYITKCGLHNRKPIYNVELESVS